MRASSILIATLALVGTMQDAGVLRAASPSLVERLGLSSPESQSPPANVRRDDAVRPAAKTTSGPQAPRDAKQQQGGTVRAKTGRSLSGFSLGRLLGRKEDQPGSNQGEDHPLPYDQQAANRPPRFNPPQANQQSNQRSPSASTQERSAATSPQGRSATSNASQPVKRNVVESRPTPRTSPKTGVARSQRELDEALAGLHSSGPAAQANAGYASGGEAANAVPDYLQELETPNQTPRNVAVRGPGAPPAMQRRSPAQAEEVVDFGNALKKPFSVQAASQPEPLVQHNPYVSEPVVTEFPDPAAGVAPSPAVAAVEEAPVTPTPAVQEPAPAEAVAVEEEQVESVEPQQPVVRETARVAATKPAPKKSRDRAPASRVLFTSRQPMLVSRVEGPAQLIVGRPASYRVTLDNVGDVAATEVLAVVTAPESADIVEATAAGGAVEHGVAAAGSRVLNWQIHELAAGESKTLELQITPRSGADLPLGVRFSHAPVGADALVSVQEPQLTMALAGPAEVQFGSPQRYKLTVANPGTGTAEKIELELLPPGGDPSAKIHHVIGSLAAGESRELELELTARNTGELVMDAAATAAGGLTASATKKIRCVKPELEIDWRGPEEKFSGSIAKYYLRVRNPGEAATDAIAVDVALPEGATLVSATSGYTADETGGIAWQTGPLQPGEERFLQVEAQLAKPGANQMNIRASTAAGLRDAKAAVTNVIAVADLKLDVADPKGPVPVGESVVYEIRVRNRGSIAARNVSIVGLFSAGIDPTAVDGGRHTVRDGRIAFQPIESLAAGEEVVLKIQAQASEEGTHVFRAEVVCPDLEMKLSAEEMTRFFQEDNPWDSAATAYGEETPTRR